MQTLAVLITCYNRVNSTLKCLEHLFGAILSEGFELDIYLVDDNSPDQTGNIVKNKYPAINVIKGSGTLYWNGGMRLAWLTAAKNKDYDFYMWLNDDTFLEQNAITVLVDDYFNLKEKNIESILVGPLIDPETKQNVYGGFYNNIRVIPSGKPQNCNSLVGNVVLVSKNICNSVGILSSLFSHGIGDTDYGIRVLKKGFKIHIASNYIGTCKLNDKIQWYDPEISFSERKRLLFSKTGGNYKEYIKFKKMHFGLLQAGLSIAKTITRLYFPKIFIK